MDLRISIVNYNTRDLLDRCLASIRDHPPDCAWELVVVDNDSRDDSVAVIREKHPWAKVIEAGGNLGYAAGNNLALHGSRARVFLVLNSDIEVHPGALQALVDHLDAHPECGLAGSRLILPDGSIQASCASELTLARYTTQQLLLDKAGLARYFTGDYWLDCATMDHPCEVEQVTGACMACRAEAIARVGPMDEAYWMYCEDSDWCQRFRAAGWQLHYVPASAMLHVLGGSSKTARAEMIAAYNRAAARYFRLHHGARTGLLARWIGLAGVSLRLAGWSLATLATLGRREGPPRQVRLFARTLRLLLQPTTRR